ncbi:hypothetical protein [Kordiimonas aquimaris]|uniref:hypothetical protein n=1 Tax=Kordiimonas aquimaris TaxID=707591 RepID=UPI0021D3BC3C|nr:hypothetical protein [Kordiimonas aquimaris]
MCAAFSLVLFVSLQGNAQNSTQNTDGQTSDPLFQSESSALTIPVYPRFKLKQLPATIDNLKDTYIVLDDGSVLSLADWVLGSVTKSNTGAGMTDYQNRLFLGQAARAAVGLSGDLIYRSFQDAGTAIPFTAHRPPEAWQAVQGILSTVIPGLAPSSRGYDKGFQWAPVAPVRASQVGYANNVEQRSSGGAILFDDQFFSALQQTRGEFMERGRIMDIVERFERDAAK